VNYEELAFLNQQLAAMLREGIPLEGSLRQLCAGMRRGRLRSELAALESDLSQGVPLNRALAGRNLPEFYSQMVQLGTRTNDLPAVLTLLADYYQGANLVLTRLKGLMIYPALVLLLSCAFSVWMVFLFRQFMEIMAHDLNWSRIWGQAGDGGAYHPLQLWLPPLTLAAVGLPALVVACWPGLRRELRWRLPAFREASFSRFGSAMAMLLRAGCPLGECLGLLEQMEARTSAAAEVRRWKSRVVQGHARFMDIAAGSRVFPPMFLWLVAGAGEDLATGFERAARAYQARAVYRTNVLLYAALPCSLMFLGLIVLGQLYPMARMLFEFPRMLFGR
jgi:type II secretory pathway component PulF